MCLGNEANAVAVPDLDPPIAVFLQGRIRAALRIAAARGVNLDIVGGDPAAMFFAVRSEPFDGYPSVS